MGLMNYYLSLGLSFFVLAAFWRAGKIARLISLALLPLIWIAHPLGMICLAGLAAYIALAKAIRPRYQGYLLLAAGISLLGVADRSGAALRGALESVGALFLF